MDLRVDIGVFAHNEADGIAAILHGLASQDIFAHTGIFARVLVLANGCTDATVEVARSVPMPGLTVIDLAAGGKSRTWNRFVHDLAQKNADILVFMDADIEFRAPDTLRQLVQQLRQRPELWVMNSQPVKDIIARPDDLTAMDRIISAASGGLDDWKTAICGQLYAMPAARARAFHLPIGLPVEDGFLRAMVLTDALTTDEDFTKIDGAEGVAHIFTSERGIGALIKHQTRIVIGSAINAACFADLRGLPVDQRHAALTRAAQSETWLAEVIKRRLPRMPYGFVPIHFLIKRVAILGTHPKRLLHPKRVFIAVIGFGFDAIVYARAQIAMLRGAGAGHW